MGEQIQSESEEEQADADEEEDMIVGAPDDDLAQLGGDGRREAPHGLLERPGGDGGVARGHENDHGLADGPAEAKDAGGQDAREGGREDDLPSRLPGGGSHGDRGLAVAVR